MYDTLKSMGVSALFSWIALAPAFAMANPSDGPIDFTEAPRWLFRDRSPIPSLMPLGEINPPIFERIESQELPTLPVDGDRASFRLALTRQIENCERRNANATWNFGDRVLTRKEWCQDTARAMIRFIDETDTMEDAFTRAKRELHWYRSIGSDGEGYVKYTGYYLPRLYGNRGRTPRHTYPLYRRPSDLVRVDTPQGKKWRRETSDGRLVPYYDRMEIDWEGALEGRDLEIAFVDDPIEAFFLHIQGSGALHIRNEDGSTTRKFVNYAAANGRGYVAIGRLLRQEGVSPEYTTLQGLRRYFQERPHEIDRVFPQNPSYVFFQEQGDGPYGNRGVKLVPGHSIATDYRLFPSGAVSLIHTERPLAEDGEITEWIPFSRLAVNQDTGGGIRGPGRVDIYWGEGDYAEIAAGSLKHGGSLFYAVVPPTEDQVEGPSARISASTSAPASLAVSGLAGAGSGAPR